MSRAFLSLGGNQGDTLGYLRTAVSALHADPLVSVSARSPLYVTAPWGPVEQPDFLNCVVEVETQHTPGELLAMCQRLEQQAGRERNVHWGQRTLDVDILAFDDVQQDDPQLTLPHPRLAERLFVLRPWADIAPQFCVSGLGRVEELLAACPDVGRIELSKLSW